MKETRIPPVHPGEVLLEDFLKPLGISQYRLAKEMKVYPRKIDLENTRKLGEFEYTTVVESIEELKQALEARRECLKSSSS